jgi:hypothetical protein
MEAGYTVDMDSRLLKAFQFNRDLTLLRNSRYNCLIMEEKARALLSESIPRAKVLGRATEMRRHIGNRPADFQFLDPQNPWNRGK